MLPYKLLQGRPMSSARSRMPLPLTASTFKPLSVREPMTCITPRQQFPGQRGNETTRRTARFWSLRLATTRAPERKPTESITRVLEEMRMTRSLSMGLTGCH